MRVTFSAPAASPSLAFALALALALALVSGLAGCGKPSERGLESRHQPVVTRSNYVLDVNLDAGGQVAPFEQRRLAEWLEALKPGYGDRIALDFGLTRTTGAARAAISDLAASYGILTVPTPPVTDGQLGEGMVRVVLTRSSASVPGCPDWSQKTEADFSGGTHSNFGCASNANLAAMIADPEDLVRGREGDDRWSVGGGKAIEKHRDKMSTNVTTTGSGGN